jgi:predicted metallo-beta-lactamase superfamily hydrolase
MKIKFDQHTMADELYNALLQHFVNEAVGLGVEVNKFTEFTNWVIECEVDVKESVH